jgi:hypothetical protein
MVVPASSSRRMVPGPESNKSRRFFIFIRTEHELRFKDGTQVPEPKMVTEISTGFAKVMVGLS